MSGIDIFIDVVEVAGVIMIPLALTSCVYAIWAGKQDERMQMERKERLEKDKFRALATLYYWGKSSHNAMLEQLGENYLTVMNGLYKTGMIWKWNPDEPERLEFELSTKGKVYFETLKKAQSDQ